MKLLKTIALLGIVLMGVTSCSPRLTPFTQELYYQNNWSEHELKKIQFYLSRDIVLYRNVTEGSSTIESGKIRMVKGQKVEELVIPSGTPGVMVFSPKDDRFAISFEDNNDERYLIFGPNPKIDNKYTLRAKEWKRRQGTVRYEGREYITDRESAYAALMVDLRKIKKTQVKRRVADGRKL